MKLYVARHGQTVTNINAIMCWQYDAKLTEKWYKQAETLWESLKDIVFDRVISSDLSRAVETSKSVIKYQSWNASFATTPFLRERSYWVWDGVPDAEIIKKLDLDSKTFRSKSIEWEEGYESDEDFMSRIKEFFEQYIKPLSTTDQIVLVTCHKWSCNAISGYIKERSLSDTFGRETRINFANVAYSIYEADENWMRVIEENIDSHVV